MPPEAPDVPAWLRGLPRAPEYRPTESEFADPIAFLSRVERHAAAFGICKVIPPYHRPSRRHVFARLNTSLHASASSPSPDSAAVFTTRHQELGTPRRGHPPPHVLKQVWQSGERYTLDQFEAKSRAFSKTHLAGLPRDPSPLAVESLFWKASADRPIYVEYANDVPGSGFGPSAQPNPRRKKRKRTSSTDQGEAEEEKASVGWRLSSSPWNLQAIARAPGSLTRFMPDDVPGVTSPMVYIGMLFSWFAWHIEDHELHSLNFLHTGAPKTWYAVPGDRAAELEEVIRVHGYGGNPDRLASLAVLGEKTTLMSPEVIVAAGLPCCRLVQYPGEFVVTFPRAYHVGFSHGFNCGEAANFATPQWLKFAKEAAVRRAVMNYLPMLSHQQLLYLLAVSFISRTPRELLYGIRTSRLRDRRKEDRELLVKQEFLQDMISENELLYSFLKKKLIANAVLWEPDLLPSSTALHSCSSGPNAPGKADDGHSIESIPEENGSSDGIVHMAAIQPKCMSMDTKSSHAMSASEGQKLDTDTDDESDLPFDLSIDSGSLTCVACGILGFPFMAILQPSQKALEEMSLVDRERLKLNCEKENHSNIPPCSPDHSNSGRPFIASRPSNPVEQANFIHQNGKSHKACVYFTDKELDRPLLPHSNSSHSCSSENTLHPCINSEATETKILSDGFGTESSEQTGRGDIDVQAVESCAGSWNITSAFVRPRIFCLQHALEIEELLEGKGGAHALIICHSDYTKLKALAISIAEEIEFQFDCKDVPLANASKSDLHLINTSIDDEGYPEDGRDWTSQMGLNMKYFAKLRKEAPGSQEQPPLSFWNRLDITDKPSAPVSVVPNLKWLCRKTRTSYRVVGYVSSHNATVTPEEANPAVTKTMIGASGNADENGKKQLTVEQAAPLQPSRLQEADDIPVALAEYPMMHQVCEGPVSVSTCDDSNCSINSQDPPAVSDAFTIGQQCVQSDELTSSASMSVQQFLVSESMTAEASSNHEMIDSYNVTSECKDKLLEVQQEQDNIELCNDADRNLATVSATPENEVNCAKTSNCSDTVLKANKSSTGDLPEPYHLGADLVTRKSSCDEMISSVDRQFSLRIGCLASTDVCCSAEPSSVAHDLVSGESKAIRNPEIPIGVLEPVEAGTSHYGVQAEGVQAAPTTAISGENGNSVPAESDSLDILLGILAEESVLADVGGKDEVDNASLTLMTLASSHSADDVTQDDEVVGTSSSSAGASLSCKGQHPELHVKRENAEEVGVWNCHGLKDSTGTLDISANKNSGAPRKYQPDIVSRSIGGSKRANIICYVRRKPKRKRKRESELLLNTDSSQSLGSFSRSPCESLRPRSNNKPAATEETSASQTETATKPPSLATTKRKRTEVVELFRCDIESCDMAFESKADLRAHLRNICTDETCGKRFGSHKYLRRHQRVHCDERPFRCPWEGCGMTFKWAWAQTEHMRVHTGERPYGCAGCGQRFRYVSDYSRHRRKFNHH